MINYFELLDLVPIFALEVSKLETNYFAAQRACHPDRFVGKGDAERLAAVQRSVDINKAYQTLKSPLLRAQYLLQLQGIVVGTDHDSVKPSHTLLTEVMELRESPPSSKTLAQMVEESITRIEQYYHSADWPSMAQETLRLGYLKK